MPKILIFACLLWGLSTAESFATDVLDIELEGVTLRMTVAEAKIVLRARGYQAYTGARTDIERMKSVVFFKDDLHYVQLSADHFIDTDMTAPGADELIVTHVMYSESANVIGARDPAGIYLCPLGMEFYARYCPAAGDSACYENDGYRKLGLYPNRNEKKERATHSLSLVVESNAICSVNLNTHRADNIEATFRYRHMEAMLPK